MAIRLRVGIDYRPALLQSAGIGRCVRELCRSLAALEGLDLRLFGHSFARARHIAPIPPASRLHRIPIPGRSLPALARYGIDAGSLSGSPEVFHWTDYIHPPVSRAAAVLTIHDLAMAADPTFHGAATELMLEKCRSAADQSQQIICPSQATADQVLTEFSVSPAKVSVIPFGCDHVKPSGAPSPLAEDYIVMVGTIEPRKNHHNLLLAYADLPAPRPPLLIIGRRGWQCEDIVACINKAPGVTWIEDANDQQVTRYMEHAQALIYPSFLEGFGFPPLEAMQLGTPVLAGDTPALREVLGPAALFCNPHDVDAIRKQLLAITTDADLRSNLRQQGQQQAGQYSWQRSAQQHSEVYTRSTTTTAIR